METRVRGRRFRFSGGLAGIGLALILGLAAFPTYAQDDQQGVVMDDVDIWRMIIRDSIASYREICPCPYSPNRAGRRCGARSAHSRVDGSVMCYVSDIPEEEVVRYRERLRGQSEQSQQ
jgi:hypothetical protein